MTESSDELFARMKAAAIELNWMNPFGALHIFVEDGNCDDEHLEFCLKQPEITPAEKSFAARMLEQFTEDERVAIWVFSHCRDIQAQCS